MTRDEKIEIVTERITDYQDRRSMRPYVELSKEIVDALEEPEEAPPECDIAEGTLVWAGDDTWEIVDIFQNYDPEREYPFQCEGCRWKRAKPVTIWDLPSAYGGPPEWAQYRVYLPHTTVWFQHRSAAEEYMQIGKYANWIIEERPET